MAKFNPEEFNDQINECIESCESFVQTVNERYPSLSLKPTVDCFVNRLNSIKRTYNFSVLLTQLNDICFWITKNGIDDVDSVMLLLNDPYEKIYALIHAVQWKVG